MDSSKLMSSMAMPKGALAHMDSAPFWHNESVDAELGRFIGYEFHRLGLVLPSDVPPPVEEGYAEAEFSAKSRSIMATDKYERKLVRLRLSAYKRGRGVAPSVTPRFLRVIDVRYCPITRVELTSGTNTDTDATVDRVYNDGAYALGNLVIMSKRANQAKGGLSPREIHGIALRSGAPTQLKQEEWLRLACLTSMSAPLIEQQSHIPMFLFPPDQIMLANGYSLIQQAVTCVAAGILPKQVYSLVRDAVHGKALKRNLDAFMEALVGQVSRQLPAAAEMDLKRFALADCWATELVLLRYHHFVKDVSGSEFNAMAQVVQKCQRNFRHIRSDEFSGWMLGTKGYTKEASYA